MTDLKNFSEKFLTSPAEGTQAGRHGAQLIKNSTAQQAAMEAFFFGYQAFTAKPDEMLAKRGLSRVHHRILFFIAVVIFLVFLVLALMAGSAVV